MIPGPDRASAFTASRAPGRPEMTGLTDSADGVPSAHGDGAIPEIRVNRHRCRVVRIVQNQQLWRRVEPFNDFLDAIQKRLIVTERNPNHPVSQDRRTACRSLCQSPDGAIARRGEAQRKKKAAFAPAMAGNQTPARAIPPFSGKNSWPPCGCRRGAGLQLGSGRIIPICA